jgi:long-chain-fatty-acid--CoA ligase ACSBG
MTSFGISGRKCINITGFNSPEWVISFIGASIADCVPIGFYTTSGPEALEPIANHSEAELVVVQNEELLSNYMKILQSLPRVKAFVVYQPHIDLSHFRRGYPQILGRVLGSRYC